MAVRKRWSAFTLVELLIVLAIVAILAMVAAPKMVESKVLSQLAQVNQDQRILQYALDSYFMDFGGYPGDQNASWVTPVVSYHLGFPLLTSPIPYLTTIMPDPFQETTESVPFYTYEGRSGSDAEECGSSRAYEIYRIANRREWNSAACIHAYLVNGVGPDKRDSSSTDSFPYYKTVLTTLHSYSPTNGSESKGDIFLLMGDYRRGTGIVDLVPFYDLGSAVEKGY